MVDNTRTVSMVFMDTPKKEHHNSSCEECLNGLAKQEQIVKIYTLSVRAITREKWSELTDGISQNAKRKYLSSDGEKISVLQQDYN